MRYMNVTEAAKYLGYAPCTLSLARKKGVLAGIPPPQHILVNGRVRYAKRTLNAWMEKREQVRNAAEVKPEVAKRTDEEILFANPLPENIGATIKIKYPKKFKVGPW